MVKNTRNSTEHVHSNVLKRQYKIIKDLVETMTPELFNQNSPITQRLDHTHGLVNKGAHNYGVVPEP